MSLNIDQLAEQIVTLDQTKQMALLEKVAELNFQHGLVDLSQMYRKRLEKEGRLTQTASEIMAQLGQIREETAAHDPVL